MKKTFQLFATVFAVASLVFITSCGEDEDPVLPPTAGFASEVSADDALTYTFTDQSTGADSYSWTFGDGETSTDASPSHTYTDGGSFEVTQTVTNAGGTDTFSATIDVVAPFSIVGDWVIASEAGALAVGPAAGSGEWWQLDEAGVTDRACFIDDVYTFGTDGSYTIALGDETWVEGWQGGPDACATPVAPYDGSGSYTFSIAEDASTFTVTGEGAFIGLPKANNDGELGSLDGPFPASITYTIAEIGADQNSITVGIEAGSGVHWTYKLVRQ